MIRVLHPITRMIIGGAQENTMLTADYMNHLPEYAGQYQVDVVCGPQTGPEGSLIEETQRRGVPLTVMAEMVREVNPVQDMRALWKLYRMMKEGRYDIVHTHSSKAGVLGRVAAKWAGVPLIVHTVHGWSFHERMSAKRRRLYVALEKMGAARGHAMVTVSPRDIEKGVVEGIGTADDYSVIRSGVELDRFGHPQQSPAAVRAALGIPEEALVVGSVTRLSPQKAPLDLIKAFAAIHDQQPEAWLVVVGDGPLRAETEAAMAAAKLGHRVVLTGLRRDVPELMAAFDVFVLSSLWEGLPRVLPQAMATGLPIVCTRVDGSAEAVIDGHNGFLTPPGEPETLAEATLRLLADAKMREEMGRNGKDGSAEFGARKMVADIHRLYQAHLNK